MDFYYIRTLHCLTMLRFVWFVVAMNIEQLSNPNQCGLSDSVSSFFSIWLWGERCVKVTDAMLDSPDFHPGAFYKNVYNVFHVKCLCGICLHKQGLFWSMLKVSSVLKAKLGKCDFYVAFSNVFHVKQQTWRSAGGRDGIELETFLQYSRAMNFKISALLKTWTERIFESLRAKHATPNMISTCSDSRKGRQFERIWFGQYWRHSILINICKGTTPFLVHWLICKKKHNLKHVKDDKNAKDFFLFNKPPILLRQELFILWCAVLDPAAFFSL